MKKNPPVNILVRVPNWIGDAVMCLPALMEIRDYFPQAKVTILARPTIGELLQGQSGVDDVMVYQHQREHKGFLGAWKLSQFVRKKRFDLAVLFQNAFEAAVIALLAGIPSRVGYETDGRGWLLSQGVPVADKKCLHQTQTNLLALCCRSNGNTHERQGGLRNPGMFKTCSRRQPYDGFCPCADRSAELFTK